MKKANVTRFVVAALAALLLLMPLMGACSKPAPSPVPAPAPAPAPAPKPAAPAPKVDPLAQVIEGARREGTVSAQVVSGLIPTSVNQALEKAIKDKYGVELKIQSSSAGNMAPVLATAIMEYKTGAAPAYDLMGLAANFIPEAVKSGAFEAVDWRPLVEPGTPPDMTPQQPAARGTIAYMSSSIGLQYNPTKIPAAEAPKKLADLLDPKWQGRLGMMNYPARWTEWAFVLGKDNVFSILRSLVKTKPLMSDFVSVNNRYLIGEIDLAFMNSPYVLLNRGKGMPTEYRFLDFMYLHDQLILVSKGAKHPNAAKLLAIFLSSTDGAKFLSAQPDGRGSIYRPGNIEYDRFQEGLKQGLKPYRVYDYPGMIDLMNSSEFSKWEKEAELIARGGG